MTEDKILEQTWVHVDYNGQIKIKPQKLYLYLKEQKNLIVTDKGNIYLYENGKWGMLSAVRCKAIIKSHMPALQREKRHIEAVYYEFCTDFADVEEEAFNSDESIINFKNGIYNIYSDELTQHDPKYLSTVQIPCDYVPGLMIDDAPYFKAYMDDMFSDDDATRNFWYEFVGAVISNIKGWRFKKLLMMVGEGNTGKTLALEIVMALIGKDNCVSIDFKKMNERFGTAPLYGKRLDGIGDLSFVELSDNATIKQLTGGDMLSGEFKGKDSFSFQYNGFIWCNTNCLPYFRGDRGEWVYERFCIVNCQHIIPVEKRDPQLIEKILAEKEAIVSITVSALRSAIIKNGFKFTESENMKIAREMYIIENNSLLTFINECCDRGSGTIKRAQFNKLYKKWCLTNSVKPERERTIEEQLHKAFGIKARKTKGYFVYDLTINSDIIVELMEN